jgi:hypothetical protein
MLRLSFLLAPLAAAAISSCTRPREPVILQPVGETHTLSALVQTGDAGPRSHLLESVRVELTTRVRDACRLPPPPSEPSRFDFDGVDVEPRGEDVLGLVAVCLGKPALAKRRVCISGYADRGAPAETEEALARAHATAVKHYLASNGLDESRSDTVLRWEPIFVGEERRALDRRIEVDLQDHVACPGAHVSDPEHEEQTGEPQTEPAPAGARVL